MIVLAIILTFIGGGFMGAMFSKNTSKEELENYANKRGLELITEVNLYFQDQLREHGSHSTAPVMNLDRKIKNMMLSLDWKVRHRRTP